MVAQPGFKRAAFARQAGRRGVAVAREAGEADAVERRGAPVGEGCGVAGAGLAELGREVGFEGASGAGVAGEVVVFNIVNYNPGCS